MNNLVEVCFVGLGPGANYTSGLSYYITYISSVTL